MSADISADVSKLLNRVDTVYSEEELKKKLQSGKTLRVKLGMDPTAPDLTLGHSVVLQKLRDFQDLGHKAVLIIGDYTAMIGDPSGKSKTRPMLTTEEIKVNAETYFLQAGKVLDLSPDKLEVRYNSEWLSKMTCADVIRLMGQMTVARLMERDTFANRQSQGKEIYSHELLYPLMQAHDSVVIKSDVELGGTDQTFNNLCGRDLQKNANQPPQVVMVMPILVGTDGVNKMSKSMGNYVAITDSPKDMFGKVMSITDDVMTNYFSLVTEKSAEEIANLTNMEKTNPRLAKEILAKEIITRFHNEQEADNAAEEFKRIFSSKSGIPDDVPDFSITPDMMKDGMVDLVKLMVSCEFAKSNGEARRLLKQNGVKRNSKTVSASDELISLEEGDILQRGKRQFIKIKFE